MNEEKTGSNSIERPEFPGVRGPIPNERKVVAKFEFNDQVLTSKYDNITGENYSQNKIEEIYQIYDAFKQSLLTIQKTLATRGNYFPASFSSIVDGLVDATRDSFDEANFIRIGVLSESFDAYVRSTSEELDLDLEESYLLRNASKLFGVLLTHVPAWQQFKLQAESLDVSKNASLALSHSITNVSSQLTEFADFVDNSCHVVLHSLLALPESDLNRSEIALAKAKSLENLMITLAKNTYSKDLVQFNNIESSTKEKWIAGSAIRKIMKDILEKIKTITDEPITLILGWVRKLSKMV